LLLFAFVANSLISIAQTLGINQKYMITKRLLSVEDGLPSRLINSAIQDNAGFMWFATANGLSRYDGKTFKNYNTKNSALLYNELRSLSKGLNNLLFIQFNKNEEPNKQSNIQVLDLNNYTFKNIDKVFPNIPFDAYRIQSISNDELDNLYFLVSNPNQIWQYNKNTGFKLRSEIKNKSEKQIELPSRYVELKSAYGYATSLITGTNQVVCIFPDTSFTIPIASNYIKFAGISQQHQIVLFDKVSNIFYLVDRSGKITKTNTNFSPNSIPEKIDTNINFNTSHPIYITDKYMQWYIGYGNEFINVRDTSDIYNGGMAGIENVFRDDLNNFWVNTARGVYQIKIQQKKFLQLFADKQIINFKRSTRGIFADINNASVSENIIYSLSDGDKILVQTPKGIAEIKELGFAILKKNDIFYTSNLGLSIYHPKKNTIKPLIANANIGQIWSLASFSDSILVIGGSTGIVFYNENAHQIFPIKLVEEIKQAPVFIYRFLKTKHKGWIAVAENGIYFINDRFEMYDYYSSQQQNTKKRLPFTGIYDFYEDKEGIAWLAMNGGGLIRWNWNDKNPMAAENIKIFTVNNGLPDNILYRIEEDAFNNLWVSSYNGLFKFNKIDFSTKIYNAKDGLSNLEFNRISSFKDVNGKMYFGGFNGVDAFNPADMKNEMETKNLSFQLVDFTKFSQKKDKLVNVLNEFQSNKRLIMDVGDRFFTVSFSLLDFENRSHRYAYRIDGIDTEWDYINENSIRISGLPYGKLTLRIKAQLSSGSWKADELIIPIIVLKPFYLKSWFWIASLAVLVYMFLIIYTIRINKLKRDKLKLESVIQKRTTSLHQALDDKEMLLKEIHHRVKNNLQVITGLLQLQKDEYHDKKVQAALNEGQSRISSIALIHQNLYQNKDLGNIAFKIFLQDLSKQIAKLFESDSQKMNVILHLNETYIDIDTAVPLGLLVNELLTNSYKYALKGNPNPKIEIDLQQIDKGVYTLIYQDNGPGFKEPIDLEHAKTLGIKLIVGLAHQLGGKVLYSYEYGSKYIIDFKDTILRKLETK
jgi:two-component sensor histidine kinase/ligand-binding sensor domain-containing protein